MPLSPPPGSATIMVVDDDALWLSVTAALLTRGGYHVRAASSPAQLLDHVLSLCAGESVQLLLTDVVMPHTSGPALAACLLALRPELRVLFMSGYHDQLPQRSFHHFLRKPFSLTTLLKTVRRVLAAPRRREPGRQFSDGERRKAQG